VHHATNVLYVLVQKKSKSGVSYFKDFYEYYWDDHKKDDERIGDVPLFAGGKFHYAVRSQII
jgi:hypothetical protein